MSRFGDLLGELARDNMNAGEISKLRTVGNALENLVAFSNKVNPVSGDIDSLSAGGVLIDKSGIHVGGTDLVIDENGLQVKSTSTTARIKIISDDDEIGRVEFNDGSGAGALEYDHSSDRMRFYVSGGVKWGMESNGDFWPSGEGEKDLGNPDNYIRAIHYKTLTDQGCLGDYSDINALDAIKAIKTTKDKTTPAGKPRLDYATFPDTCYKPAEIAEEDVFELGDHGEKKQRFKKGKPKGEDGVEITALISVMLQAIRELADKNEKLEKKMKEAKQ